MMVALALVIFVLFLGLRIALIAVIATVSVRGGRRAGTSLMGASLKWRSRGICHTIKPLIAQTIRLYPVFGQDPMDFDPKLAEISVDFYASCAITVLRRSLNLYPVTNDRVILPH